MARPPRRSSSSRRPARSNGAGARRRSAREEPEETGRRGRRAAPAKTGPNPTVMILGIAVVVLVGVAIAVVSSGDDKPQEEAVVLGAPATEGTTLKPEGPASKPMEPLTPDEVKWIEGLFAEAAPLMDDFHKYLASGMKLKGEGDNYGANDEWVKAKKAYTKAIGIVAEAMEDFDRFPMERQEKYMRKWSDRMADWQKEYRKLPKVDVR